MFQNKKHPAPKAPVGEADEIEHDFATGCEQKQYLYEPNGNSIRLDFPLNKFKVIQRGILPVELIFIIMLRFASIRIKSCQTERNPVDTMERIAADFVDFVGHSPTLTVPFGNLERGLANSNNHTSLTQSKNPYFVNIFRMSSCISEVTLIVSRYLHIEPYFSMM